MVGEQQDQTETDVSQSLLSLLPGVRGAVAQRDDAPHTGGQAEHEAALIVLERRRGGLVDVSLEETAGQWDGQVTPHHLSPGSQLVAGFARAVENTGEQHHQHSGRLDMKVVTLSLQGSLNQQLLQDRDEGGQQAVPAVLLCRHVELSDDILENRNLNAKRYILFYSSPSASFLIIIQTKLNEKNFSEISERSESLKILCKL